MHVSCEIGGWGLDGEIRSGRMGCMPQLCLLSYSIPAGGFNCTLRGQPMLTAALMIAAQVRHPVDRALCTAVHSTCIMHIDSTVVRRRRQY